MSRAVLADLERLNTSKPRRYNPHPLYDNFGAPVPKEEAKQRLGLICPSDTFSFSASSVTIRDWIVIRAFSDQRMRQFPVKVLVAGEFYVDPKPYMDLISGLKLEELMVLRTQFVLIPRS
jgi:hypothetical protein